VTIDYTPAPPRYQMLDRGVLDTDTGERIDPDQGDPRWRVYLEWLAQGHVPLPKPVKEVRDTERYVRAGAFRSQRQEAKMSDAEFIELLRKGKVRR
jgi:hypothetical protein